MPKICSVCNLQKEESEFSRNLHHNDGLNYECKECQKAYFKEYYKNNKKKQLDAVNKRTDKIRNVVSQIKENRGCLFCNENISYCLDFHHLDPKVKDSQVGAITKGPKLIAEIEKCVLVCSNCHRKIHHGGLIALESHLTQLTDIEKEDLIAACLKKVYKYHTPKIKKPRHIPPSKCPDKETLVKLISELSQRKIAKKYGVSSSTVNRWIKRI